MTTLATVAARANADGISAEEWREDLHFVVESIQEIHPKPFLRTTEAAFGARVAELEAAIPDLDDDQIVMQMMQLVASIGDGHTMLIPAGPQPVRSCYPLRVHRFYDGLYIVFIRADLAHLAGGKILRVGNTTVEDALARVSAVSSGDSEVGRRWPASLLFTMPHVLHALGLTSSPRELDLTVVTPDGRTTHVALAAIEPEEPFQSWSMRLSSGLFEPPPGVDCVDAFGAGDLPLHLQGLRPRTRVMWFEHLKKQQTLYVQLNAINDTPEESFAAFNDRLWRYVDAHASTIDRLVFDLRFNRGGNGYLLLPLTHELIRHEALNQRGKLFALVGNVTFSAAVNLLGQMIRHTGVTVVGEPTGGPLNWCSDIEFRLLPHSHLPLIVSTLCWQGGHPSDNRGAHPPDFPVLTSGADFMAGHDPVLQPVLEGRVRMLADVLRIEGAEAFRREARNRAQRFASYDWWTPLTENELNALGYEMLEAERVDDAIAAFELNAERHPDSAKAVDSLAEGHYRKGDLERAAGLCRTSLELDPANENATRMLERIRADRSTARTHR
jgi:tetratricopeptide (TPR) repeat protein